MYIIDHDACARSKQTVDVIGLIVAAAQFHPVSACSPLVEILTVDGSILDPAYHMAAARSALRLAMESSGGGRLRYIILACTGPGLEASCQHDCMQLKYSSRLVVGNMAGFGIVAVPAASIHAFTCPIASLIVCTA